jgi:hypothetical protein
MELAHIFLTAQSIEQNEKEKFTCDTIYPDYSLKYKPNALYCAIQGI